MRGTKKPRVVSEHLTELGNARRLIRRHGSDLRYLSEAAKWLIWDDRRWVVDLTGEVTRRAKETVESIYTEATASGDTGLLEQLKAHAEQSERAGAIRAMVELAATEPGVPITAAQLDADPWLLNVNNGTIDLRSGELRPHHREDLLTKLAPVECDPTAIYPEWDAFLSRIFADDDDLVEFVQRIAGYSLTGDTREECFFVLYGEGRNGKGTFINALRSVMGDYAKSAEAETFLRRKGRGVRNDVADLAGVRFVETSEANRGEEFDQAFVKQLSGGDAVKARFLYREFFEFKPQFKLAVVANHRPKLDAEDYAVWERVLQVPFTVTIPATERDPGVKQRLSDPAVAGPAILAWMVRGCLAWQARGLDVPECVRAATREYRDEMDWLSDFLEECCALGPGNRAAPKTLTEVYVDWSKARGERPLSVKDFKAALESRGFEQARSGDSRFWQGVAVRAPGAISAIRFARPSVA